MKIQVEVISQELVKPSSPTPHHLRHLHMSLLDQLMPPVSISSVHFYSNESTISNSAKFNSLKQSLSQVLTLFYPLAGRVRGNTYIDYNDEGFLYVEARAACKLSDVLEERNPINNNFFTPLRPGEAGDFAGFSQITLFECGGLAISFGMSHKLGDALSAFTFLNSWAAMARGDTEAITPTFGHAAIFPPIDIPKADFGHIFTEEKFVTKIFAFDGPSIETLKAKYTAAKVNGRRLSRMEALVGFILGRYIATTQTPKANNTKCMVNYAVDLRQRMEPLMPKTSFGNLVTSAIIKAHVDSRDEYCAEIVERIRDSVLDSAEYMKKNRNNPDQVLTNLTKVMRETYAQRDVVSFTFSSLNGVPVHESDFGWGKPVWVGNTPIAGKNIAYLYGTKDGEGVEAWISLNEEDMAKFEADDQLIRYTSSSSFMVLNVE